MTEHVAITGASTGIGEAIAREFAKSGARLSLASRRKDALDRLCVECGAGHLATSVDLSDPERAVEWLKAAEAANGPVDVLVNNAGVQIIDATPRMDVEAGEQLLRLNLFTPLRLTRHVLPGMVARGRGTIVDVSSMAAIAPTIGMYYYNASKAGLAAASEALRGELRGTGVHVVTVYPGIIMTEMGERGLTKYETSFLLSLQPRGSATRLARMVHAAVRGKKSRVIYPAFNALGRTFPSLTRWLMDRLTPPLRQA